MSIIFTMEQGVYPIADLVTKNPLTNAVMRKTYDSLHSENALLRYGLARVLGVTACATLAIESVGQTIACLYTSQWYFICMMRATGIKEPRPNLFKLFSGKTAWEASKLELDQRWSRCVRTIAQIPSALISGVLSPKQTWETCTLLGLAEDHRSLVQKIIDWLKGW